MEEADVQQKLRRAAQLLFLPRPRAPGVKGWELRRALGKEYLKIVELLETELAKLSLHVKVVHEAGEPTEPTPEQWDRARFFIVLRAPPSLSEVVTAGGWRVDDLSLLAASIAYLVAHAGKAPRKEAERLLRDKFPAWRVEANLDRFVRRGYLNEDEQHVLTLGWRTQAEVDQKTLLNLLLATPTPSPAPIGPPPSKV